MATEPTAEADAAEPGADDAETAEAAATDMTDDETVEAEAAAAETETGTVTGAGARAGAGIGDGSERGGAAADADSGGNPDEDTHRKNVEIAHLDGVDLAYETFGDPADPAILLVMGLGTQMLGYHEGLCQLLADAGHHVIRFDNRDSGLSTQWTAPVPSLPKMVLGRDAPYTIGEMADDAMQLVDHLGLERFHVVGTSMGGFIAQTMAIGHADRLRSLTLVMTSTGSRRVGRPTVSVMRRMARAVEPTDRAEAIEANVATYRIIGSPNLDEADVRRVAGWSWDRNPRGAGRARQLAAILAQPDRTALLRRLDVPTLVVHGLADPLVTPSGGLALAEAIPDSVFIGHHGMGHDLTRSMWEPLGLDLLDHIERRGR